MALDRRLRRLLPVTISALLAILVLGGCLAPPYQLVPEANRAPGGVPGFEIFCFYSHSAQDDPIVMPDMPGMASHLHDFAGNETTSAGSTENSLRVGATNCKEPDDTAAYWTPTLYSHGVAIHPDRLHSYYRWGQFKNVAAIQPIPAGLKIIAGDAKATGPQSNSIVGWNCGIKGQTQYDHPISCGSGDKVVLHIFFPNCWNGRDLDSPDHKSHMAYSHNGTCPAGFPVPIARLSADFGYPTTDGSAITLSSGAAWTAHVDFWNTWRQAAMNKLTHDCINRNVQCGPIDHAV
jgi:hypothetical protein